MNNDIIMTDSTVNTTGSVDSYIAAQNNLYMRIRNAISPFYLDDVKHVINMIEAENNNYGVMNFHN